MSEQAGCVWTVGYEGREVEDLIELLSSEKITTLVDVRIRAGSRKRGMSKTALAKHLEQAGIGYVHIRSLGTPKEMLRTVRETGVYDWDGYQEHMLQQTDGLKQLSMLVANGRAVMFCYEANVEDCHRKILAKHLSDVDGVEVVNL